MNKSSFEPQKILSPRGGHFLENNEQNIFHKSFHCCGSSLSLKQGEVKCKLFLFRNERWAKEETKSCVFIGDGSSGGNKAHCFPYLKTAT